MQAVWAPGLGTLQRLGSLAGDLGATACASHNVSGSPPQALGLINSLPLPRNLLGPWVWGRCSSLGSSPWSPSPPSTISSSTELGLWMHFLTQAAVRFTESVSPKC